MLIKPINNQLSVSHSKENKGTTRGKEKKKPFDLGGNRTHDRPRSSVGRVTKNSHVPLLSLRHDSPPNRSRLSLSDLVAQSAE